MDDLTVFTAAAGDTTEVAVRRAFASFRTNKKSVCVIVLPTEERPARTLVDQIVRELEASPTVKFLTIVHPSPAVGFLTSSIGLKVPMVQVRAFQEAASAGQRSLQEYLRLGAA